MMHIVRFLKFVSHTVVCGLLLVVSQAAAQCPGWHNPTSFSTNNNQFFYSGKVISSLNSSMYSTVGVGPEFYGSQTLVQATGLSSQTAGGCYGLSLSDGSSRFIIKNAGNDPNTGNNTSFLPRDPSGNYYLDNNGVPYTSSIRVGTECTDGAEVLYYQMKVNSRNCLLTLWYAPVVQTPTTHNQYENSALIIRVTKLNGSSWDLIDERYEYVVSGQPQTASFPNGLVNGENGWHLRSTGGYTDVWYKDWTKAMISLDQFLNATIRIEVYMSACKYNAHYAYCYIAGDSQPMTITTSGCPAGSSTVVDTLRAPQDMMDYDWYRTTSGFDIQGHTFDLQYLDTLPDGRLRTILFGITSNDTIVWERVENGHSREYLCQADDFLPSEGNLTGQPIGIQSFMCRMTSYIDPNKPFQSFVYQRVENNKPQLFIDTLLTCDKHTTLINQSMSPNRGLDRDLTHWTIYNNPNGDGDSLALLMGDTVDFHYDTADTYYARLWVCTDDDATCYTDAIFPVRVLENPSAHLGIIPDDEPCIGDAITLVDSTFIGNGSSRQYDNWSRRWSYGNTTIVGDEANPQAFLERTFDEQTDVTLAVRNGLCYLAAEGDTVWCADTVTRTVKVFSLPSLTISDDTIVCAGSQTNVTVEADVEGRITYEWYEHLDARDDQPILTGNVLRVMPPDDVTEKTYYVKVTRQPQGCVAWGSVTVHIIRPTVHQSRNTICQGDTVTLWGDNAHHYSWAAAPGDESLIGQENRQRIVVTPMQNTTYSLIGHGSDDCMAMPVTASVEVLPYPIPSLSLSPSFIDSEDPEVTFTDHSPYSVATEWNLGNAVRHGAQVTFRFDDLNRDSVAISMITTNSLGCSADTVFFVPIQRFSTWIPNTITPNKPDNRYFSVHTVNELEFFEVLIYDRRGVLVFKSDDQNFAWDGTHDGEKCPQGVYIYYCRYRRPGTSDLIQRTGTVTLLR